MSKTQGDEEKGIYGDSEPAVQVLPASDGDVHVDVHTKLCECTQCTLRPKSYRAISSAR
jgi:hypothetical protein